MRPVLPRPLLLGRGRLQLLRQACLRRVALPALACLPGALLSAERYLTAASRRGPRAGLSLICSLGDDLWLGLFGDWECLVESGRFCVAPAAISTEGLSGVACTPACERAEGREHARLVQATTWQ